ncbi:hypothetical protein F2Q70_00029175 [Brassica cretica]|uniref:Uncharacterized protein n=1 Tax=Brassica cretica TaxID=69181 RepID=A0A8S9FFW9_BRACR|nr:hypothetical protein F2Q70_00029175 [Brassica cretica]
MQLNFDEQKLQFKLHSLEKSSRGLQALQLNHGRPLSHLPPLLNQMHQKSLTINIDVTAMKELLRLTQTNEHLWIKTDGCLDVLSLKSYENAFPRLMTLVEMLMDSVSNQLDVESTHVSLTINIDVTAMKELLRLTQTNEPLWIKTDGCLDVLSLKSYENAFPRLMTLVEMLMDSVKARELFPSVVAASKTLGVVSSKIAWKSRRCLTFDNNMI